MAMARAPVKPGAKANTPGEYLGLGRVDCPHVPPSVTTGMLDKEECEKNEGCKWATGFWYVVETDPECLYVVVCVRENVCVSRDHERAGERPTQYCLYVRTH